MGYIHTLHFQYRNGISHVTLIYNKNYITIQMHEQSIHYQWYTSSSIVSNTYYLWHAISWKRFDYVNIASFNCHIKGSPLMKRETFNLTDRSDSYWLISMEFLMGMAWNWYSYSSNNAAIRSVGIILLECRTLWKVSLGKQCISREQVSILQAARFVDVYCLWST